MGPTKLFRLRDVRKESKGVFPLRHAGLGASPQFPMGGRVGNKDAYLIGTMLVQKTSASLTGYPSNSPLIYTNARAILLPCTHWQMNR